MAQKPDVFRIHFEQNPHFSDVIKKMKKGDPIKFEVVGTYKDSDLEGADITVEAIVPEGYEIDENAPPEPDLPLNHSDALLTPATMMVRRKQAEKGK